VNCEEEDEKIDFNKIKVIANQLRMAIDYYLNSIKITKLLLNEQTLESLKFFLSSINEEDLMINVYNKLIRDLDPFIDPNYENEYYGMDFLTIICETKDFSKLAAKIIARGYNKNFIKPIKVAVKFGKRNLIQYLFDNIEKSELSSIENDNGTINQFMKLNFPTNIKLGYIEKLINFGFPMDKKVDDLDIVGSALINDDREKLIEGLFDIKIPEVIDPNNIILAIKFGSIHILRRLLENNVVHQKALTLAIKLSKDEIFCEEIVDLLLSNNHSVDNFSEENPLHMAIRKGFNNVVVKLLNFGANPFDQDYLGNNALHIAIIEYNLFAIEKLLDFESEGVSIVNTKNKKGENCIIIASTKNNAGKIIDIICSSRDIDLKYEYKNGKNLLMYLFDCNNLDNDEKVKLFYKLEKIYQINNKLDKNKKPLIIQAIEQDNYQLAKVIFLYLVDNGIVTIRTHNNKLTEFDFENILNETSLQIETTDEINFYPAVFMYLKSKLLYVSYRNAALKESEFNQENKRLIAVSTTESSDEYNRYNNNEFESESEISCCSDCSNYSDTQLNLTTEFIIRKIFLIILIIYLLLIKFFLRTKAKNKRRNVKRKKKNIKLKPAPAIIESESVHNSFSELDTDDIFIKNNVSSMMNILESETLSTFKKID
jgi:ankyrin repeat protein